MIDRHLDDHLRTIDRLRDHRADIEAIAALMIDCLATGGRVFWLGNGGSAADSQHLASELVGRFERDRPGLASLALTTDSSALTAIGNDYGFDQIFARQVEALCRPGDLIIGISTSGNSPNVLRALEKARALGAKTAGFGGRGGGSLKGLVDACLIAPSDNTARIQEAHLLVGHILCDLVEAHFAPPAATAEAPAMFEHPEAVLRAVRSGFGARRVLVIGDLMLDRYLWGQVQRISPEAPVPVVHLTRRTQTAGGAANVARNLSALGLEVQLAGVTGDDEGRAALLAALAADGIQTQPVVVARDRATTIKTRVLGNHQQMLRIDEESSRPLAPVDESALWEAILPLLPGAGALVLSDYAKGVLSDTLCRRLLAAARAQGLPILVDPKGRDFTKYAGASLITPNRAELALTTGVPREDLAGLLQAATTLMGELDLGLLVLTLSELGLALVDGSGTRRIPALAREVFDVSGAGDTVIATFAAGLAAGLDANDTAHLANLAAGVVVGKVGTVPITGPELLAAISGEMALEQAAKILDLAAAQARVQGWQAAGERVVFTNGCFDLLHVGHVSYLELARRQGQRLVVGLNTDQSVRALKGPARPLIGEQDRARVLAALAAVDAVVLFDEATPLELILALRPDVLAKGADYREEEVVGAPEVKSWGGQLVLIPLVDDRSTTGIIQRLDATRGTSA